MKFINRQRINRIFLHALFWIISILANSYVFKVSAQMSRLDFYYAVFSHLCLILGAYINIFILIPLLLQKQRYGLYALSLLLNALANAFFYILTFNWIVDWVLPDYFFVSQFNIIEAFIFVLAYLLFTTLLRLSESWFEVQEKNKQILLAEKESIDNQLKALKAQINPHFLFNSLNVIYAEALKKSSQVPEIILKLSDILRYVINKSKSDTIKISDEIALINDYVQLQKYRMDDSYRVTFDWDYDIDHRIVPMLFLPLIENSFKHGVRGDVENTYVNIRLSSDAKRTLFTIENNKSEAPNNTIDSENGIGLENIKKRLLLLYPNRHSIHIANLEDKFIVEMSLAHG